MGPPVVLLPYGFDLLWKAKRHHVQRSVIHGAEWVIIFNLRKHRTIASAGFGGPFPPQIPRQISLPKYALLP